MGERAARAAFDEPQAGAAIAPRTAHCPIDLSNDDFYHSPGKSPRFCVPFPTRFCCGRPRRQHRTRATHVVPEPCLPGRNLGFRHVWNGRIREDYVFSPKMSKILQAGEGSAVRRCAGLRSIHDSQGHCSPLSPPTSRLPRAGVEKRADRVFIPSCFSFACLATSPAAETSASGLHFAYLVSRRHSNRASTRKTAGMIGLLCILAVVLGAAVIVPAASGLSSSACC